MDAELETVKTELRRLQGCTILTLVRKRKNVVERVDDKKILIRRTAKPKSVYWQDVFDIYSDLKKNGVFTRYEERSNGAFIVAALANLTNVEVDRNAPQRKILYLGGIPRIHLRATSPYRICP